MSASAGRPWRTGVRRATGGELHARRPDGDGRVAEWYEVTRPAIVLGSAQPEDVVDRVAAGAAGVDVVRRHSGGGAVLLVPGEFLWLDVVVPRDDPLWSDDVGAAMWWLGEVWAEALVAVGAPGAPGATVHRGPLQHTRWSRLVCFDGVGAGEVVIGERKAVGISQRRTRDAIRLQSSLHLVWRPDLLVSLLAPAPHLPTAADLREPVTPAVAPPVLRAAVDHALSLR
ncbi:MAG: lipoate--protein ligase family protein [Acidimicrobiales bacterium]|nr:lipoate--protein ligase family protein [Acidimicrobiales bacterium]MCB9394440.1 lipoate--protein ligase family protein [Acidimicrobiaceae bacterium]